MNTNNRFLQITKLLIFSVCLLTLAWGKEVRAQSPVSFQVKAGAGIAGLWGKNTDAKTKFPYKVGVGMEYAFNGTWALQPSLNFVSKGCKDEEEGVGKLTMNQLYLELPVMMAARLDLTETSNLVIAVGPYVAYGVGGKTSADIVEKKYPTMTGYETFGGKYKLDTFGDLADGKMGNKRFDAGVGLGITYENRNVMLGLEGQLGLVNVNDELKDIAELVGLGGFAAKNVSAFVTVGYRF